MFKQWENILHLQKCKDISCGTCNHWQYCTVLKLDCEAFKNTPSDKSVKIELYFWAIKVAEETQNMETWMWVPLRNSEEEEMATVLKSCIQSKNTIIERLRESKRLQSETKKTNKKKNEKKTNETCSKTNTGRVILNDFQVLSKKETFFFKTSHDTDFVQCATLHWQCVIWDGVYSRLDPHAWSTNRRVWDQIERLSARSLAVVRGFCFCRPTSWLTFLCLPKGFRFVVFFHLRRSHMSRCGRSLGCKRVALSWWSGSAEQHRLVPKPEQTIPGNGVHSQPFKSHLFYI